MIRTEYEYRETLRRLDGSKESLEAEERKLREEGLTAEQAHEATAPARFFAEQIRSELLTYERLKTL